MNKPDFEKLKYKAEDFKRDAVSEGRQPLSSWQRQYAFNIAQAKFDAWYRENIEGAPVVYGHKCRLVGGDMIFCLRPTKHVDVNTHKARLIEIQEINPSKD